MDVVLEEMDSVTLEEYSKLGVNPDLGWQMVEGVPNKSADAIRRIDSTWSACNLEFDYSNHPEISFERLQCRICQGFAFEVLKTDDYETSARCVTCGYYYVVHSG